MTDARQPKDPEGGALLWSPDGTLTVRRTAAGYRIIAETFPRIDRAGSSPSPAITLQFNVQQQDDIESFIDQLKRLIGSY